MEERRERERKRGGGMKRGERGRREVKEREGWRKVGGRGRNG